jgi:hypothetical protein
MRAWVGCFAVVVVLLAAACTSGGSDPSDDDDDDGVSDPTYWADINPIMDVNCVTCHQTGGIAPFPLTSYTEVFPQATGIGIVTASRYMPPSNVDNSGACGNFADARWLSDAHLETIANWVAAGAPEGNPADEPTPIPTTPQVLPEVNHTLDIGLEYTPSLAPDEYRCFLVDGPATDQYLTAYETVPGNDAIVHHVVLFSLSDAQAQTDAEALDAGEGTPTDGYTCFGGAGVDAIPVTVWAPGTGVTFFPAGTGIQLTGGRKMVLQLHYNTSAVVGSDRTTLDLDLEPVVTSPALMVGLLDTSFTIPPGETAYPITVTQTTPAGGTIRMVYPHMHKRGRTLRFTVNGGCETDVPSWNFGWQQFFTPVTPITVQGGDVLEVTCTYDTQADLNPITGGEGTDEEMCGIGLYATL